jgi:hypothetical protein
LPRLELLEDRTVPSFLPTVNYPVGVYPQAIVTADFNGDGKFDLATVNNLDNTVSVLLGNGDGTFQAPKTYNVTGLHPVSLAVGDFNGDHVPDLVTANATGDLSVLLGNGDGTFAPATSVGLPTATEKGVCGHERRPADRRWPSANALFRGGR